MVEVLNIYKQLPSVDLILLRHAVRKAYDVAVLTDVKEEYRMLHVKLEQACALQAGDFSYHPSL